MKTWLEYHKIAETKMSEADVEKYKGNKDLAKKLYLQAAKEEHKAFKVCINISLSLKARTLGITAISFISLYLLAGRKNVKFPLKYCAYIPEWAKQEILEMTAKTI